MFCSKCGAPLNGAAFCSACGTSVVVTPNVTSAPQNPTMGGFPQTPTTNALAVAGFVVSLVGFFWFNWVGAVFGIVALNQINKSGGREGGRGLAIAAIVIGGLFVVIPALAVLGYLAALGTVY